MSFMTCCVTGCTVKHGKGLPLHRFPNPDSDKKRFESWVKHIGGEITTLEHNFVFLNRRVCHKHFEPMYYQAKNRLFKIAVPSLQLASHIPKRSQKIEAASSRKQTDEVVHVDDSPDDLSMYCDDETSDDNNRTDRHDGFHCNICNGDIFGYRYTCVQCSELDLCASCESIGAHAQHYMLRVPGPRPYIEIQTVLSRIRKYLLKNSDPISSTADFDSEETVSLKSEIKSENEENDVEDVQQVDAVTKNELEPGENSSPLPSEPQCSKDTNCELTLPNNNTAGVQHVKILLTGLMDEKKNRKLLIVKSNDKTDPILTSTAKRKIVGNSPDSGEPKGLAQVAKRLCVMPNTNKQNIKQTITVCSQNVEPEQTNLKYLIIPSNIVPLQIRSPKKPQTNTAGGNS